MTTLALRKTFSMGVLWRIQPLGLKFLRARDSGWVSAVLVFFSVLGVAVYLTALYRVTDLSFRIERERRALADLEATLLDAELTVQTARLELAKNQPLHFSAMEKISAIKYLTPKSFVASLPDVIP